MKTSGTKAILVTDHGNASIFSLLEEKRIGAFCNDNGLDDYELTPDNEFTSLSILENGRSAAIGSSGGTLTIAYY